ncbi:MAG: AgmX/PglI C-terminal domain-containing protein [Myxococcales bacterium]|nr:AgmX/PglI C-terminal domain-containing protein [Myxococcales bacterium]
MQPGLHALNCVRCGAPLDPGDSILGAVVRCGHCAQAHLWVAPDRVEAQGGVTPRQVRPVSRAPLVLGAALLVVLMSVGVGAALLVSRSPARSAAERRLPQDAPVVIGDQLEMSVVTARSSQSCSFTVLGVEADGRVLGVPCNGTAPAPVSRELLGSESYRSADPGSIALVRGAGGWVRAEVLGPEPGERVRLRALGETETESVVTVAEVFVVQRAGPGLIVQAPLPAAAPLEVGDLITRRDGAMLEEGRVTSVGEAVSYEHGSAYDGTFEKFAGEPKTVARGMLLARVVTAGSTLQPGDVVLGPDGTGWKRFRVELEEPNHMLKVSDAGQAARIVKQGLFLIRVGDKLPAVAALPATAAPARLPGKLAMLNARFRRCYNDALAKDPKAEGKVVMTVEIGAKGEVTGVDAKPTGNLPPSVVKCMTAHVKAIELEPPLGGKATYVIPVVFQVQ